MRSFGTSAVVLAGLAGVACGLFLRLSMATPHMAPLFVPWAKLQAACAVAAGLVFPRRAAIAWAGGAAVGALVPLVVTFVRDLARDPTSHNLLGIELVGWAVVVIPPLALGVLVGAVLRSLIKRASKA